MNCPVCNGPLSKKNRCDRCGEDFSIFVKIYKASNSYYNEGLSKAKVRDLTGAIYSLRESLKLYKKNTKARNLLGLVYYEMGESVLALSEWVLSKHFQPDNNDADEYMKAVQSNPTKLETINQAIKKYNSALISANQGNEDLAIIQLKKVTNLNPHFIRAHHLLALLYMKNNENEKARKCLLKVSKIDVTNTKTLRYLKELGEGAFVSRESTNQTSKEEAKEKVLNQTNSYMPISSYKEDKPNIMAFVNLIVGVVIGLAVGFFLLTPTIKNNATQDLKEKQNSYIEQIGEKEDEITTLKSDNDNLQSTIDDLNKQVTELEEAKVDESLYENLFNAAKLYAEGDKTNAAKELVKVDEDKLAISASKDLYKLIKDDTFASMSRDLYNTGHSQYNTYKYEEAIKTLKEAVKYDKTNVDAIYFLARAYHQTEDYDNAKKYYNQIIDDFADSYRAGEAKSKLSTIE
jgi:Flp pilus assembly protein TadD